MNEEQDENVKDIDQEKQDKKLEENNQEKQEQKLEENNQEKQEQKVETKEKKKGNKKTAIIASVVIIVVLIVVAIGGFFSYQYVEENKSVGSTWGDTYYAYLKEASEQKDLGEAELYGLQLDMENAKLQFCEVEEDKYPYMVMTYEKENKEYVNVYQIGEDNKVTYVAYKQPTDLVLLYNIELQQYIWYIHMEDGNQDSYIPLQGIKEQLTTEETENTIQAEETTESDNTIQKAQTAEITADYTIKKDEATTVETVDGTTLSLSKFDETFIKPEVESSKEIDYSINMTQKEIKKAVTETVAGYKTEEEMVTDEVKTKVETKVTEINTKKEEIKTAEEEKKKKEEEEVARKAAEEEAKGLKVGNYRLKYGNYVCDYKDSIGGGTYTINKDGTFSWVCNWTNVRNEKYTDTARGTYKVYYSTGDDYDPTNSWIIEFNYTTYHSTYEPSNAYAHDYIVFDVTKDNTFQYRQSVGTFTYQGE